MKTFIIHMTGHNRELLGRSHEESFITLLTKIANISHNWRTSAIFCTKLHQNNLCKKVYIYALHLLQYEINIEWCIFLNVFFFNIIYWYLSKTLLVLSLLIAHFCKCTYFIGWGDVSNPKASLFPQQRQTWQMKRQEVTELNEFSSTILIRIPLNVSQR